MTKSTTSTNKTPPAGQPGAGAAADAATNTTALRKLIDRLHVVVDPDSDFVELHLDNETIAGGNGPEAVFLREFGRLIEAVKTETAGDAA